MKNPTIAGAGKEAKVIGTAFGLQEGATSGLIEGDKGDNKELLKKLDEVRDAVLLGALIEMDGDVLTRGIGGKLEKQLNRSNFASRLVS